MARAGATLEIPVICIGNLVVGGAGKTPTALEVASVCRKLKLNPGFLTRGYGGRERGPLCVSVGLHTAAEVGDEALLLAQFAPTVIAADRPSGAKLLALLGADVVVMDDGFQNPSLRKDLSLVVIDSDRGIGNGLVLPGRAAPRAARGADPPSPTRSSCLARGAAGAPSASPPAPAGRRCGRSPRRRGSAA